MCVERGGLNPHTHISGMMLYYSLIYQSPVSKLVGRKLVVFKYRTKLLVPITVTSDYKASLMEYAQPRTHT